MAGKKGMYMPPKSAEWRANHSLTMKGNSNHKGFKHTAKAKLKVSIANKGKVCYWKGKHLPPELILKRSNSRRGTPAWNKGKITVGKELSALRHSTKRRGLGNEALNTPIKNYEAHHIDREHVVFIPKWLHRSIWHSLNKPDTMKKINMNIAYWILIGGYDGI